ncbi:MAG: tRNA (N(6)-L-threonylcarbamoyladenosine(37)-C(2))-methylthiotransferase MtaB [Alphaproteobacteria bacterium]|nr:tRNA (N(6)-L-threonylcarbamoyladenosine(37)-C(2))-methylthiotransferase MtaB [Alphaproteobacteria bacterium]
MADVINFGCRLNIFEGESMAALCSDTDMVIINSCSVTTEASRQVRQTIRRIRRDQPHARIVVTGCGADTETQTYLGMEEVNTVLLNGSKMQPLLGLRDGLVGIAASEGHSARPPITQKQRQVRAHLEVQNGCNHSCTFCIIPMGRGPARSIKPQTVVEDVKALVGAGHLEVVLTGVDLTSYGEDLEQTQTLGFLVKTILEQVPDLPRLRLSSLDAIEMDDQLFELIAHHERLMPHLHLSLQSGDNMVLKRMKRRHQREDAIALCQALKSQRPQLALGADMIAGFPTETDTMFASSLAMIDECKLDYLHVFPFSPRPGTPAARMPQVDKNVIKQRAHLLRKRGQERQKAFHNRLVGGAGLGLVEQEGQARLENFALVKFHGDAQRGSLVPLQIMDAHTDFVQGELL